MVKKSTIEQKEWNRKYPEGKAQFSWSADDYKIWGYEVPDCLLKNSKRTEGEQLGEKEVEQWVKDSVQTLMIMRESNKKVYKKLYKDFVLDMEYLFSLGKISENDLDSVMNDDILRF